MSKEPSPIPASNIFIDTEPLQHNLTWDIDDQNNASGLIIYRSFIQEEGEIPNLLINSSNGLPEQEEWQWEVVHETTNIDTTFIDTVNIFSDLTDSELKNIQELCKTRKYPKNSMIILEEEMGDVVFIVMSGTVKITRVNDEGKEVILAMLGSGEVFGEMAILDGESRSANALSQENCEVITINREDFLNLLKTNNKVSLNLMTEFAIRLRKSDQQIEALSLDDAEHRIGVSILNLAEELGVIRQGVVTVDNLPYQQDIANMAGTSRETVSRVMKIFEDRGLITKAGHKLSIPDYAFFKRIFG